MTPRDGHPGRPSVALWLPALVLVLAGSALAGACPESCICKWKGGKQTVECINKGLIALPSGMDPETQVLDVSGSTLQILHRILFQRLGLVNLQRVYLSRCRIGHLDDLTFQGLTNLVELDLSENMLTSMPAAALAELPALMRLSLARNPLQRIPAASFRSMRYLTTLELSNCELEVIEEGAFDGLKSLELLKLDGNALRSVGGSTVLPRSLHGITLHGNPWRCDCHLSQMRAWLVQFNIPLTLEPKCSAPERLSGRLIKSLDTIDFACPPEMTPTSMFLEVAFGKNVTLHCKVSGDPEPRVTWWYRGRRIPTASSSLSASAGNDSSTVVISDEDMMFYYSIDGGLEDKKSELTIINATDKENGTFVCTAENRAGSAQANFSLFVVPLPTTTPPPPNIEYVVTVGGVVAAIVITLVIIVVAVAVRCCCCRRRHSRRTHDKPGNLQSTGAEMKTTAAAASASNLSHQLSSPHHIQINTMLPSSLMIKSNGYSNSAVDNMDQSPDLINDTTTIKWKENGHGAVSLVDGHYPLYDTVRLHGHYPMQPQPQQQQPQQQQGHLHSQVALNTISQAVLQEQHYYGSPGHEHHHHPALVGYPSSSGPFPGGEAGVLNPGHYLDADGFPVDYGLPRPMTSGRTLKSGNHQVRFAEPPSSIRHYENYVVDSDGQMHSTSTVHDDFLPDRKYPDTYTHLAVGAPTSAAGSIDGEIRYPSERYPQDFGYPAAYSGDLHLYSPSTASYQHSQQPQQQQQQQQLLPSPPEGYKNSAGTVPSPLSHAPIDDNSCPAYGTAMDLQMASSSSSSSEPSVAMPMMIGSGSGKASDAAATAAAAQLAPPLSPLEVSVGSSTSSAYAASGPMSILHRQPHESPDEGYEDEGVDGTEI